MMTRMEVNRDKARQWDSFICPKIKKVLEKNSKQVGECILMKADDWHFQIMGPYDQHTVDVLSRSCSCMRWDLTGIPCRHVISAIWCRNEQAKTYVHDCYKVSTYLKAYEPVILPLTSQEFWLKCDLTPPLPPSYENRLGRPKTNEEEGV
ncbi:hypothetical protein Sango_0640100 [Sesamum angolense]|uniref:SWIM-type domain-containing protein n=1 Tax=Sesamum angolense TaxID=2727404 RepID=A0AAE1X747_9LAMI|nr:hypothetical protein Sango_0640100 [Sesamum angolense]